MTGEEMERAIEFLIQSQTNLETQVRETNRQLQSYAETQSEFIGIMTRNVEALTAAQGETDARLNKTDERLNKLIGLFEQHIVAGHQADSVRQPDFPSRVRKRHMKMCVPISIPAPSP